MCKEVIIKVVCLQLNFDLKVVNAVKSINK